MSAEGTDSSAMRGDPADTSTMLNPMGLPFLVTHWLANYQASTEDDHSRSQEEKDAVERIHRAASDIASAFSVLGSFGRFNPVCVVPTCCFSQV
jgi:hypothetical protein